MSASAARSAGPTPLPRPLLTIGIPVAAVLLTGLFFVLGFPYDRLRDAIAVQASRASGADVTIERVGPGFSPLGPVFVAEGVSATLSDGTQIDVESLRLRPAWSLTWLSGSPAVALDLRAPEGRVHGTVIVGEQPGFDGHLEDVALDELPIDTWIPDLALDGIADARVDLRAADGGPRGSVSLHAAEGSLGLPGLPVAVPFETFEARAELDDAGIRVKGLRLDGPMLAVAGEGTLARSARPEAAALDARLEIDVREAGVRPMARNLGVRLDREGRAEIHLGGTLSHPVVR